MASEPASKAPLPKAAKRASGRSRLHQTLLDLTEPERLAKLRTLSDEERKELRYHWKVWAREQQLPPAGDWRTWLVMAGRGFGKTRAGAEWVRAVADADPDARIALVAASLGEARAVMVEGDSGVTEISAPRRMPVYEPSLRRLSWPNGAQATLYSAAEPEALRGPQHSHAWCDEVAKWDNASGRAERTWDNLLLGLRLGGRPRIMATTTPRAVPLMQRLLAGEPRAGRRCGDRPRPGRRVEAAARPARPDSAGGGMSDAFGPRALRLARLAARALGWRPADFWAATPAELTAIMVDDAAPAALSRHDLTRMMEHDR